MFRRYTPLTCGCVIVPIKCTVIALHHTVSISDVLTFEPLTTSISSETEELPVRLAHRVKELDALPCELSDMPSTRKVKNWYAQSFEVRFLLILPTIHT